MKWRQDIIAPKTCHTNIILTLKALQIFDYYLFLSLFYINKLTGGNTKPSVIKTFLRRKTYSYNFTIISFSESFSHPIGCIKSHESTYSVCFWIGVCSCCPVLSLCVVCTISTLLCCIIYPDVAPVLCN